jgi:hypothetical protein
MHEIEANVAAHGDLLSRWMREIGRTRPGGIINFGKQPLRLPSAQQPCPPANYLVSFAFSVWSV